jgi:hypothetical protein
MKRLITFLFCFSTLLLSVEGTTADPPLVSTGYGLRVAAPPGWASSKAARGSVLSFQSIGDKSRRIHVRVASGISQSQSQLFFAETHASLTGAGFKRSDESARVYSGHTGRESLYQKGGSDGHQLVVWCLHKGENAWIVTGFFSAGSYPSGYASYQTMLGGLVFEPQSKSGER